MVRGSVWASETAMEYRSISYTYTTKGSFLGPKSNNRGYKSHILQCKRALAITGSVGKVKMCIRMLFHAGARLCHQANA